MGRRLPPGVAAARAKERSRLFWSGEAHKKYDPKVDGYGSPDQWEAAAYALFGGMPSLAPKNELFAKLGIDAMPANLAALKKAMRAAMMKAHPDQGGTDDAAKCVLHAYVTIKDMMERKR